jgi:hypothetical protein
LGKDGVMMSHSLNPLVTTFVRTYIVYQSWV